MTERIFIANENGDWWVHVPGDGLTWIRESDLLKIVKEEYGEDDLTGEDLDGIDK